MNEFFCCLLELIYVRLIDVRGIFSSIYLTDDSELSELLDNALEEAAAQAVFCGKENLQLEGVHSETETTDNDDVCDAYSDPELSSALVSVKQDIPIGSVTRGSFRADSHGNQSLIQRHSLRRSTSQKRPRRRQSASIANALLDGDCPTPTPSCARPPKREDSAIPGNSIGSRLLHAFNVILCRLFAE